MAAVNVIDNLLKALESDSKEQSNDKVIGVGDDVPSVRVATWNEGPKVIQSDEFFKGRKVVVFSIPGAYTPTCQQKHTPGYVQNIKKFKELGVDVACLALNDPFVLKAFLEECGSNVNDILPFCDIEASFSAKLGKVVDLTAHALLKRPKRYAFYVNDGKIEHLFEEPGRGVTVSGAEHMLETISKK